MVASSADPSSADLSRTPLPPGRRLAAELLVFDRQRHAVSLRSTLASAELRLLWLFSDGRARTMREIADELRLEQSTVNRQVNGAIQAGHLYRFEEPGSPARLVAATPEGRERFTVETELVLELYDQALASLGDEDRSRLLELFGRFVDAYADAVGSSAEVSPAARDDRGRRHLGASSR